MDTYTAQVEVGVTSSTLNIRQQRYNMWSQLAILAGLSLSAVVSAAPVDTRLTNAERIQRGLPLNAPKKRYVATRTRGGWAIVLRA